MPLHVFMHFDTMNKKEQVFLFSWMELYPLLHEKVSVNSYVTTVSSRQRHRVPYRHDF